MGVIAGKPTTEQLVTATKRLLERAPLEGSEVPMFNEVTAWLDAHLAEPSDGETSKDVLTEASVTETDTSGD